MIEAWGLLGLAMLAGASVVVQQALNASLRTSLGSAVWSGVASYLVGLICMALLALMLREPVPAAGVTARLPWHAWTGGLFGAVYVGLAILLVPRLGAATFVAFLVAGQVLTSAMVDQLGWFGLAHRPLDLSRGVGLVVLVVGVVLVRR